MNQRPTTICTNLYGCNEAAKLKNARGISPFHDKCACGCEDTIPHILQRFILGLCPICSCLSELSSGDSQTVATLSEDCREALKKPFCTFCGCEYDSLKQRKDDKVNEEWIARACAILDKTKGNQSTSHIAKGLFDLCNEWHSCDEVMRILEVLLYIMIDEKRIQLMEKIRKAENYLGMEFLPQEIPA